MPRSAIIRSARPQAGREICAEWPDHVYQWHREGFDLPAGGELLAEGDAFSGAGVPLWHRLCAAVPPRGHPRHDVSLAGARRPSHGAAGRQAARTSMSPTARCTIMPRATGSPPSSITGSAAAKRRQSNEKPAFALRASAGSLRDLGWLASRSCEGAKAGGAEGIEPLTSSLRTRRSPN